MFEISPFLTLIGDWETGLVRIRLGYFTLLASVPAGCLSPSLFLSPIHIWSFLSTDHRPRPSPCHSSSSSLRCLSDRWCDSHGDPVTAQSGNHGKTKAIGCCLPSQEHSTGLFCVILYEFLNYGLFCFDFVLLL